MEINLKENERIDDLEFKNLKIIQNKKNFCFGIDSILLSDFAKEIKSNSYERLINKPDKIDIIIPKKYSITTDMRNPIIIEVNKEVKTEKDLELSILANLEYFFKQLGEGFTYVAHQYKLVEAGHNYYIDFLLFNYKLKCFTVIELKLRELKKEDKAQIEFYMNLVDKKIKEIHHNKTIGIIITKESDEFIVNFVRSEDIIPLNYELRL